MEREKLNISNEELIDIIRGYPKDKIIHGFLFIKKDMWGYDPEDGGVEVIMIIKRISDNKFFKVEYQGWDLDNDFGDWEDVIYEVFPKEVTTTIYE